MNEIRAQIQETSKRIKRLGESSLEIGEIVELISDITEQTNVLALNAAIQAASAGEAGRGFTVVAEEVQRLAERSAEATKQIEAIVKTIQADTQDAVAAMEKTTVGVVEGAKLSDAAGQALTEIGEVSRELAAADRRDLGHRAGAGAGRGPRGDHDAGHPLDHQADHGRHQADRGLGRPDRQARAGAQGIGGELQDCLSADSTPITRTPRGEIMSTAADFDIGPLTWVKSEIDQALAKALHQPARVRRESERLEPDPVFADPFPPGARRAADRRARWRYPSVGGARWPPRRHRQGRRARRSPRCWPPPSARSPASAAYLDQLLGGELEPAAAPLRRLRDVLKARGRESVDPVDLYYPDLQQRPPRREKPPIELAAADAAAYYRDQRGRYQRGPAEAGSRRTASGVEDMRAAVAAVEAAQTNPATRTFWWVALGFFDALFAKAITDAALVTRLANRIEHQLKRLMEGSGTVAERMMREALFAVARARPATEHVRNVQEVFRLAGTVPATFELKGEGAPQNPSLRALKELVANAKTAWNKVATGHQSSLANFRDLATQMRARAAELKQQNLVLLAHDIVALAGWIGDAAEKMSDNIAMEVATALLAGRERGRELRQPRRGVHAAGRADAFAAAGDREGRDAAGRGAGAGARRDVAPRAGAPPDGAGRVRDPGVACARSNRHSMRSSATPKNAAISRPSTSRSARCSVHSRC